MKKRSINIIAILVAVLVIAIAIVTIVSLSQDSTDLSESSYTAHVQQIDYLDLAAFSLNSVDEFNEFAKKGEYECFLGSDGSGGSIYGVPVLGEDAVITYYFDKQGNTTDFQAFYYLNADVSPVENFSVKPLTTQELADGINGAVAQFCTMFEYNIVPTLYLSNTDGTFVKVEDDSAFQRIAEGGASLTFSIRDKEGYFWKLSVSATGELISANISKYFDKEKTKNYVANISLYEEG